MSQKPANLRRRRIVMAGTAMATAPALFNIALAAIIAVLVY